MQSTITRQSRDGTHAGPAPDARGERNRLLIDIPDEEASIIEEVSEVVDVKSKELMTEAGGVVSHVHFPQTAVISLVVMLKDAGVEALTVGNDGMTGTALLHGCNTTYCQILGQIPGTSRRISAKRFIDRIDDLPEVRRRILLYSQLAFETASQSAACNRMHVTEERCARWLLLSHDRVGRDEFELTQGFLSQMLGVRRPAVTVAIGILEKAGLICHQRGLIEIADRGALEKASCECYAYVKRREREFFG